MCSYAHREVENAVRRAPVAPRASALLIVYNHRIRDRRSAQKCTHFKRTSFERLWQRVVNDEAHVGLVDAHAERDRRHHHPQPTGYRRNRAFRKKKHIMRATNRKKSSETKLKRRTPSDCSTVMTYRTRRDATVRDARARARRDTPRPARRAASTAESFRSTVV
jgi:hypothetical protein